MVMGDDRSNSIAIGSAGAAVAIGVGGLLVPVRDVIGNTNSALVLVVVIVAAASIGGRLAGAVTSAAACLSFNFFHTQPLYTLRIHSSKDIWTTVLLFTVGLVVGQVAEYARNSQTKALIDRAGVAHLEEIGALVAEDQPLSSVWPAVRTALLDELRLIDAKFEPGDTIDSSIEVLERNGRFGMYQQRLVRRGDRDMPGTVPEIISAIDPILLHRINPDLMGLGLLIGKRSRRHVQVLLRQRNHTVIGIAGFMHDAVTRARNDIR